MSASDVILDPGFMRQLDRLDVVSRKVLAGKLKGERRSKRKGQSVEFADYRQYVVGDDLRFIDWNLYARLDRLFLRLFMEEEDLSLSVLLDVTPSMAFGDPQKLAYGRQVAAALAYIGLVHYNRVSLYTFGRTIGGYLPNLRGRRPVPQMLAFLAEQRAVSSSSAGAGEAGNLAAALKRFTLLQPRKGMVVVISDMLDKGDIGEALRSLSGHRYDAYVLHVLSPQEIDPALGGMAGDLRLRDREDGEQTEITVTPALLKRYRMTLDSFCSDLRQQCLKRDIAYLGADTSVPFDRLVLRYLRERGMLA